MDDERGLRAGFCAALEWLPEEQEGAALRAAVRSVLDGTATVRQAIDALGVPEHVLTGPESAVRGWEPGDSLLPGAVPRAGGEVYRCPEGWCGLNEPRRPSGTIPAGGRCWLHDRPLRVVEA
ncbi:hypothetical protein AB0L10_20695 [Streptomyces flaveolus]|uniref:hypothetical protein n=1 Tax=Streptomyces flaveolus TaxID=67297 RepID=UPI00341A6EBC